MEFFLVSMFTRKTPYLDTFHAVSDIATLSILIPDKEVKPTYIFIFKPFCGVSKGFLKALKAFTKPFEAQQRDPKIKI